MRISRLFIVVALTATAAVAQAQVARPPVDGVTNFAKLDTTIACAGATTPAGVESLKALGYASIINLRESTEDGANVDAEAEAAKAAGLRFIHLPVNGAAPPDPATVDRFIAAVTDPANQPALVHCATGNRASMMWMIKRMVVDGWDADRAGTEAAALGLTSPKLKQFAIDYAAAHGKK